VLTAGQNLNIHFALKIMTLTFPCFLAFGRLFGAANVIKLLMDVPLKDRADTAKSLIYEAKARY
jgi:hypothetical protein